MVLAAAYRRIGMDTSPNEIIPLHAEEAIWFPFGTFRDKDTFRFNLNNQENTLNSCLTRRMHGFAYDAYAVPCMDECLRLA